MIPHDHKFPSNSYKKRLKSFCQRRRLNPRPFDPKSHALTVRLQSTEQYCFSYSGVWLFYSAFGPFSLQTISEVANHIRIELSGFKYLCNHAFLGSKCVYGVNERALITIHIPAGFAASKNRLFRSLATTAMTAYAAKAASSLTFPLCSVLSLSMQQCN